MTQVLKQSTAVDVLIGPFLDITDGATAETGESPSVKLSKNGQTLAAKNDVTTPTHDADGYYNCEFNTTDTNTVGTLVLTVAASANALPVRHEFQVIEENVYDMMYASNADLGTTVDAIETDTQNIQSRLPTSLVGGRIDANTGAISGDVTAADNAEAFFDNTGFNASNSTIGTCTTNTDMVSEPPTVASVADGVWDEATSGHTTAGTFGEQVKTDIDAILVDTNELQTDDVPGLISALNNISASQVNSEMVDVLTVDANAEPTGVPAANEAIATKIGYLFMALRNQIDVTSSNKTFYDDSGTAEYKKALSDNGTTYTESEASAP